MFDLEFYYKLRMVVDNLVEPFSPTETLSVCKSEFKKHMNIQWETNYLAQCCQDESLNNYIKRYLKYFNIGVKRTCFSSKFISY